MTLLTIIQGMCDSMALDRPVTVIGNADGITREMLGALNDAGNEIKTENDPPFAGLTRFATFTSTATEYQADLVTIAPDYGFMVNDTLWNTSSAFPVGQSITPQEWAFLQVRGGIAPYGNMRILVNPATGRLAVYVQPAPSAGMTFTFEYISKMWVTSTTLNASTSLYTWDSFQTDNDTTFFNEQMLKLEAIWRFKLTKGSDDWQVWKGRANAYTSTIKTQEVGTPSFYVGTYRGTKLIDLDNIQDGNYPSPH